MKRRHGDASEDIVTIETNGMSEMEEDGHGNMSSSLSFHLGH